MRANSPQDVYKRSVGIDPTGRKLVAAPNFTEENVEVVGVRDFALKDVTLRDGTVGIRLNKCDGFYLSNLAITGMRNPLGGDDGHGVQAINCGGTIHYNWIWANEASEDNINIIGDEPATESKHVIIELCRTYGRSGSDTCTHICIDGPHPPKVTILQNRGLNPRCYLMLAGGNGHDVQMNASYGADTDCYIDNYYEVPGSLDRITIERNTFPKGLLIGHMLGAHNKFQEGRQT